MTAVGCDVFAAIASSMGRGSVVSSSSGSERCCCCFLLFFLRRGLVCGGGGWPEGSSVTLLKELCDSLNELEGLTRLTTTGVLWLEGLAGWPGGRCRPPATEPVEIMESRLDAEELPILFFHCEYKLKNRYITQEDNSKMGKNRGLRLQKLYNQQ